jgi:hypothetical protein
MMVNNLASTVAADFSKRYENHPSDVIDPKTIWSGWQAGIESTGMNYIIEAAEQLSAGVPLPPELFS